MFKGDLMGTQFWYLNHFYGESVKSLRIPEEFFIKNQQSRYLIGMVKKTQIDPTFVLEAIRNIAFYF